MIAKITHSKHIRQLPLAVFLLCLVFYFTFYIFSGQRNLFAYFELDEQLEKEETKSQELRIYQKKLETKIDALHPNHLRKTALDDELRKVLGYVAEDEYVIFVNASDN